MQRPSSGPRSDGQIEMDVVHALDASEALKNDLITAATIQSEVTLSGTVSSDSSKQLAESIAKTVPGVTKVHNNLKVGNPADDANAQGAAANDPSNDMADAQAPAQGSQDNGQYAGAGQEAGAQQNAPQQNSPSLNQAPPPNWGDQNAAAACVRAAWLWTATSSASGLRTGSASGYGQQAPPPGYGQAPPPVRTGSASGVWTGSATGIRPAAGLCAELRHLRGMRCRRGPVTIPPGTSIQVRTNGPVDSKRARGGEPIEFTVIQDVAFGGVLAIPRGATVRGVIAEVKRPESGSLTGSSELALELTSLELMGQSYPLQSDMFKVKGPGKGGRSAGNVVGGALIGAIIGGAIGHGEGAAIGAVAGGGAGAVASAASSGPGVWIPAEALVSFHLALPVTVQPVTAQEAMRLAQGLESRWAELVSSGAVLRDSVWVSSLPVCVCPGVLQAVLLRRRVLLLAVRRCETTGRTSREFRKTLGGFCKT